MQKGGDYRESFQPAHIAPEHLAEAQQMAEKVTRALTGYGLWGVEFFLSHENGVYFSELSPRPHDTGMVTFRNQTALSSLKYSPELRGLGINLRDCVAPEDISRVENKITEIVSGGQVRGMQFTVRRTDGTTFPALANSSPILRDGKYSGIRGAVIDISDQVMAKEALRRTNLKLALLSSVTRHDILNQVTAMLLFKELLKQENLLMRSMCQICLRLQRQSSGKLSSHGIIRILGWRPRDGSTSMQLSEICP